MNAQHPVQDHEEPKAEMKEIALREIWWLRAPHIDEAFHEAARNAFGHPLPPHPNQCVRLDGIELLHLQPDAWLCIDTRPPGGRVRQALESLTSPDWDSYCIEMTAAYRRLQLNGRRSRLLLASLCVLDLSDVAFPETSCAITRIAEVALVLTRSEDVIHLDCPRSYVSAMQEILASHIWSQGATPSPGAPSAIAHDEPPAP